MTTIQVHPVAAPARPSAGIPAPVHLVGIGGVGMSGLARILIGMGQPISGSDLELGGLARALSESGAVLHEGNRAEHVPGGARAVVVTAAVPESNPELAQARRMGLKVLKYAEMVGEVSRGLETVAVAGTHGKSTTTALVSWLLTMTGLDPTFLVGAMVPQLGTNAGIGLGRNFVIEACEYDRSFHNYEPYVAVITNVEPDHLDYYKDFEEIRESFRQFAARVRPEGRVIVHSSVAPVLAGDPRIRARIETYGFEKDCHWRARAVRIEGRTGRFRLECGGKAMGTFRTNIPGVHNVLNATAAVAAAWTAGAPAKELAAALPGFAGCERRFQVLLDTPELTVVDDYAHHPTEIRTVIEVARKAFAGRRLWVVFQPHQHSRTRHLLEEFAGSFLAADRVIIPDIYASRDSEEEKALVHARDLVARILVRDVTAYYVSGFEAVIAHLEANRAPGDVVLVCGAGNVTKLARELVVSFGARRGA